MSHMVIFESQDGSTGQQHCDDLDGAVGYVESLRNEQGIDRARIFRLEEVNFQVTPYYVVSLAEANGSVQQTNGSAPEPVIPAPPASEGLAEEAVAEQSVFGAAEERSADPFAVVDEAPADAFAVPAEPPADPFTVADEAPIEAMFGDTLESTEAPAAVAVEPEIPPIPSLPEEAGAEEPGRRGLFGR